MKLTHLNFLRVSLLSTLTASTLFASNIEQLLPTASDAFTVTQSGTEIMRVDGNGSVGIGTDTPTSRLHVEYNNTNPSAGLQLSTFKMIANPPADNNTYYYGSTTYTETPADSPHYIRGLVGGLASATRNGTGRTFVGHGYHGLFYTKGGIANYVDGVSGQLEARGGVTGYGWGVSGGAYLYEGSTVNNAFGTSGGVTTYADAISTNLTGVDASINHTSTANTTSMKGINIKLTGSGTATNAYGLYINNVTHGSTKSYSIYSAGGESYFEDNITVNSLAGTGNAFACIDATGKLYRSTTACN